MRATPTPNVNNFRSPILSVNEWRGDNGTELSFNPSDYHKFGFKLADILFRASSMCQPFDNK